MGGSQSPSIQKKLIVRNDTLAVDSMHESPIPNLKGSVDTERLQNIHSVRNIAADPLNYKSDGGNILTNVVASPN